MAPGKKMLKVTNSKQYELLVSFMEGHPEIAKGYISTSEARETSKALWDQVATECNIHGPPIRDSQGWKKVWSDFKFCIKKKLRCNQMPNNEVDSRSCRKFTFSPLESKVIEVLDLTNAINQIRGPKDKIDTKDCGNTPANFNLTAPTVFLDNYGELLEGTKSYYNDDFENEPIHSCNPPISEKKSYNKMKNKKASNQVNQKKILNKILRSLKVIEENSKAHLNLLQKMVQIEERNLKIKNEKLLMARNDFENQKQEKLLQEQRILEELDLRRKGLEILDSSFRLKYKRPKRKQRQEQLLQ